MAHLPEGDRAASQHPVLCPMGALASEILAMRTVCGRKMTRQRQFASAGGAGSGTSRGVHDVGQAAVGAEPDPLELVAAVDGAHLRRCSRCGGELGSLETTSPSAVKPTMVSRWPFVVVAGAVELVLAEAHRHDERDAGTRRTPRPR